MEAGITKIIETLLGQGSYGLIIIILGFIAYKLYSRNQELQDTLYEVGRESVKASEATAAALTRLTDMLYRGRPE